MCFLLAQRYRQPALIIATSFLMFHGAFAVFYAYSDLGDKHIHKWLRDPENKKMNTFLFMMCSLGYGYGMYTVIARQWMVSV